MTRFMSEAMKRRWSDPAWAARQRELIAEGRSKGRPSGRRARGGHKRGNQIILATGFDPLTHAALERKARADGVALAEIVRTYVQWGLDAEGIEIEEEDRDPT